MILHDDGGGTQETEDVSTSYDGFEFWARASSPGAVRVNFPDVNSDPLGGVCSTTDGTCFQYWGLDLNLDTNWRLYRVHFDQLYTKSDLNEPFDPHALYRIEFAVDPATSIDLSIDDADFFRYSASAYYVSGREFRKQFARRVFHGLDRPSLEWDPRGDHLSRADLELMAGWGADTVRISLNQDFWLTDSPAYDASYAERVDNMVACAHTANLDVILDLHWSDMGDYSVTPGQQQMADAHSVAFWKDVAARYKNNSRVLFELYKRTARRELVRVARRRSGHGLHCGRFQNLYDAVRGTGAENVVLAGGLSYAFDLSGVLAYPIRGYNIGYVTHPYNSYGKQPADWPAGVRHRRQCFPRDSHRVRRHAELLRGLLPVVHRLRGGAQHLLDVVGVVRRHQQSLRVSDTHQRLERHANDRRRGREGRVGAIANSEFDTAVDGRRVTVTLLVDGFRASNLPLRSSRPASRRAGRQCLLLGHRHS